MARRLWTALLSTVLLIGLLPGHVSAADPPPHPDSMAALGDSISQAASSGGSLGTDYPENSWSTGTSSTVSSHYLRILAQNPSISGRNHNLSVSGARMADLAGQAQQAVGLAPDYVTILMGGNDLCTDTVAQMTPVATFRAQFEAAMQTLSSGSPNAHVYVVSIPNVYRLWELFRGNWWARVIWSFGNVCQSLLEDPLGTDAADVARRQAVAQRNVDFNTQLAEVCAAYARCRFDGLAVYNTDFVASDAAGDYFHPSISGQAKLASVSWAAGYWSEPAPPPNTDPVAAFAAGCEALSCTFDGSASTDADGSIVTYAWDFGGDGIASGATSAHTFSAPGDYLVTLTVTDDDGATDADAQQISVSTTPPDVRMHVAALEGSAAARKGGWTASVTVTIVDQFGSPIDGAAVSGSWSSGQEAGCTTGGSGTCSFSTNMSKKVATATWTVGAVTHVAFTYDPAANVVTQVPVARP